MSGGLQVPERYPLPDAVGAWVTGRVAAAIYAKTDLARVRTELRGMDPEVDALPRCRRRRSDGRAAGPAAGRSSCESLGRPALRGLIAAQENASVAPSRDEPVRCPACGLRFVPDLASGRCAHEHIAPPGVFRREGEYWLIMFEGDVMRLRDTKGLRCLAALLANPGREMLALQLVAVADRKTAAPSATGRIRTEDGLRLFVPGDREDVIDAKARSAYKQRLDDLRAEADGAEQFGDAERLARAKDEIEALVQALSSVIGLGGRTRQVASPAERARQSVTKAIKAAAERIAAESPALAQHLASTLRTGSYCVYDPDPRLPATWRI